jgi:hypothetical protein
MDKSKRFWRHVDTSGECWLWVGTKDKNGYGVFTETIDGCRKYRKAHRVAYELEVGVPNPREGDQFRHLCGVHACVRPSHLKLGTARQNADDRRIQGRGGVLTFEQAEEIRDRIRSGEIQRRIAEDYGVSYATITFIKQNKTHRPIA